MAASENWEDELIDVPQYDLPFFSASVKKIGLAAGENVDAFGARDINIDEKLIPDNSRINREYTLVQSHPLKLYVSNVNFKTSQKALWTFMEQFGDVEYCRLLRDHRERSKGRGFVTYKNLESCKKALAAGDDKLLLHKRTLKIEQATWKKYKNAKNQDIAHQLDKEKNKYVETDKVVTETVVYSEDPKQEAVPIRLELNALPDDCLLLIFHYLPVFDKLRLEIVCKRWRELLLRSWQSLKFLNFGNFTTRFSGISDRLFLRILKQCGRSLYSLDLSAARCRILSYKSHEQIGVQCINLQEMNLSGSLVSNRSLRSISKGIPCLKKVVLQNCLDIGEKGLWWLFHQCQLLEYVDLTENRRVTGQCFHRLTSHLHTLLLKGCSNVVDEGMKKLKEKCSDLEEIDLNGCTSLTDAGIHHLCSGCIRLKKVDLSNVSSQVTLSGMKKLQYLFNLQEVILVNPCNLSVVNDELLETLSENCRSLRKVDISRNDRTVTDIGIENLAKLPSLTHLTMSYLDQVGSRGLMALAAQGTLQELVARGCPEITDAGIQTIVSMCPCLVRVDVSGCHQITSAVLTHLVHQIQDMGSSTDILHLHIGGTSIDETDDVPACVKLHLHNLCDYSLVPGNDHRLAYLGGHSSDEEELDEFYHDDADDFLDYDDPLYEERFFPT